MDLKSSDFYVFTIKKHQISQSKSDYTTLHIVRRMLLFHSNTTRHLSKRQNSIKESFRNVSKQMDKSTEALSTASLAVAKQKEPHNTGETLIKPALIDVVSLLCGDNNAEKI